MASADKKAWGGRFSVPTNRFVEQFTASVNFDQRLAGVDIKGSTAHAHGLLAAGVLTAEETRSIIAGLHQIQKEIEGGEFVWSIVHEDVHMNIEARLVELIGETGKKLHTGRSRNDQVATDMRLWLRDQIDQIDHLMTDLLTSLTELAELHADTIMPGFTHLQIAQPVTFGHHLMAWFEMLLRDRNRLRDSRTRVNQSPLGAAALAGTSFAIDREAVAEELRFEDICRNSLDAVSDRDFAMEFACVASITMIHLSRWCEELVLWNSDLVGFVNLPDEFCTGSSIMPQKKNPDVPELVRGKSARVTGDFVSLLMLMKSQPLAYNKDNQEDKEPLFDAVDTLVTCITALRDLLPAIEPNKEKMREAIERSMATATDLADWLVRKGIPFREAHAIVGRAVSVAMSQNKNLIDLSLENLQQISDIFDESVFEFLSLEGSVAARKFAGGTATQAVHDAIVEARNRLQ